MAKEQAQKNQAQTIGLRNAVHPSIHFDTDGLSERRSYCKFKSSIRIPGFFYNGKAPAKFERADWRYPCESQTIGITYIGPLKFSWGFPIVKKAGDAYRRFEFT